MINLVVISFSATLRLSFPTAAHHLASCGAPQGSVLAPLHFSLCASGISFIDPQYLKRDTQISSF